MLAFEADLCVLILSIGIYGRTIVGSISAERSEKPTRMQARSGILLAAFHEPRIEGGVAECITYFIFPTKQRSLVRIPRAAAVLHFCIFSRLDFLSKRTRLRAFPMFSSAIEISLEVKRNKTVITRLLRPE